MDENNADIYFLDTRNADRDHRGPGGQRVTYGGRMPVGWSSATPAVRGPVSYPATVQQPSAPQVIYAQPAPTFGAGLLAKLTTGDVISIVSSLFAVLQSLPAAPVPTKDAATDAGNMILYQSSLASYAKRDEQVRTLGTLLAKLVG